MNRLQEKYMNTVRPSLVEKFNYTSVMQAPQVNKIVVNMGVGDAIANSKVLDDAVNEMTQLTGQKPIITKAKKSIAGFKLREDMQLGLTVTLRKEKMYSFLERLINLALPRLRDFDGLYPNKFDINGNYNFGINDQLIFPEINYDEVDQMLGFNITIVTTAKNQIEGLALLKKMGLPFRN